MYSLAKVAHSAGFYRGVLIILARLEHPTNPTRDPHSGGSPWTPRLQVFDVHKESAILVGQIISLEDETAARDRTIPREKHHISMERLLIRPDKKVGLTIQQK